MAVAAVKGGEVMGGTFRIGRVAGIRVDASWSLLVIFWLIAWALSSDLLPVDAPRYATVAYWVAGVATTLVFYGSLLAHEIAHSVAAERAGIQVEGITLWLLGGVSKLQGEAVTPGAALRIAVVGPLVSAGASAVFAVAAAGVHAVSGPALLAATVAWLARINLILAAFNLVPAAPLDGGRVLAAVVWRRTGDRARGTVVASRTGETFAYLLIILGLVTVFSGAVGGLWFALMGWFLLEAARAEAASVVVRGALDGVTVDDVMTPDPIVAPASLPLDEFIDEYLWRHPWSAFPVIDGDERLAGLVTFRQVKAAVTAGQTRGRRVGEVATPLDKVVVASPDSPLIDVMAKIAAGQDGRAVVVDSAGRLVGIVSLTDISRAVDVASMRGRPRPAPR